MEIFPFSEFIEQQMKGFVPKNHGSAFCSRLPSSKGAGRLGSRLLHFSKKVQCKPQLRITLPHLTQRSSRLFSYGTIFSTQNFLPNADVFKPSQLGSFHPSFVSQYSSFTPKHDVERKKLSPYKVNSQVTSSRNMFSSQVLDFAEEQEQTSQGVPKITIRDKKTVEFGPKSKNLPQFQNWAISSSFLVSPHPKKVEAGRPGEDNGFISSDGLLFGVADGNSTSTIIFPQVTSQTENYEAIR